MFKKIHLLFFIFAIGSINCISQTSEIEFIKFNYSNSIAFPSAVEIKIYRTEKAAMVEITSPNRNAKTVISREKYEELCEKILKIVPSEILKEIRICLDGGSSKITFSNSLNHVEYAVDCLLEEDESTVYKDFFNSVKLILEVAKLKFTDLR